MEAADSLTDERARDLHSSLTVRAFYPSLHLNLAEDYRRLGDPDKAREHLAGAERALDALPDGGYATMIRRGITRLATQLSTGSDRRL